MQQKLLSLYSEPETQEHVNRKKEHVRGLLIVSYKLWQVVKVALAFPILGKSLNRDLSPLKPIMVEGNGDRVVRRLVLGSWAKDYGMDKYRPLELYPYLNEAEYKYSSLNWFYTV